MLKEFLSKLPDALAKKPDSVIGKTFAPFSNQYAEIIATLQRMQEWMDIDKAQGKELDEIGGDVEQPRGIANDAQYRMMIRSKRVRAKSDGSMNAIIDAMAKTLNCKPTEMRFLSDIEAGGTEPLALVIEKLPLAIMLNAGLTQSQLIALVEQVAAGDVRVSSANLEGTFEFGTVNMETDHAKGFGDAVGTVGGYFGALYVPEGDQRLPI